MNDIPNAGNYVVEGITCAYHAWSYDTAGQLRALSNEAGFAGFYKSKVRLGSVRLELFLGLILVNLDAGAQAFAEMIAEAMPEIVEDGPIVESVQRGMESGGFDVGPLLVDADSSSQSEHPIMAFNVLYRAAMARV